MPVADPTPATRQLYTADWARFAAWCREQQQCPLPASADTVAGFLLAVAPDLSRGSLGRHKAAIRAIHLQSGHRFPALPAPLHKAVRYVAKPPPPRHSSRAPSGASLLRLAERCPRDLAGLRDRALFLLAGATRPPGRSTARTNPRLETGSNSSPSGSATVPRLFLLALDAEDVQFTAVGVVLRLRVRIDEAVPSRMVTLLRGAAAATCPVRALEDWLRSSGTAFGPVFRKVDRWGNVEHGRLGADAWHRILARRSATLARRAPPKTAT